MNLEQATAHVADAVAKLDERCGNWWSYVGGYDAEWNQPLRSISLDTLRTSSAECCPLGQMYGTHDEAPTTLQRHPAFYVPRRGIPVDAGASVIDQVLAAFDETDEQYEALDRAWLHAIKARRNG